MNCFVSCGNSAVDSGGAGGAKAYQSSAITTNTPGLEKLSIALDNKRLKFVLGTVANDSQVQLSNSL
jgi:uncharacterized lipoprotein